MSEFSIEKNIPISPQFRPKRAKYPLRQMKIGDSFVFTKKNKKGLESAVSHFAKRNEGYFFIIRALDDNYFRCWRVINKEVKK